MVKLNQSFEGHKVKILDIDGVTFVGEVGDFIYADDNEPEINSIVLDNLMREDGHKYFDPIEFYETEIVKIEVIS